MTAGVYVVRHAAKRLVYVGSSFDLEARCRIWSSVLWRIERKLPADGLSAEVIRRAAGTRRSQWRFVIVEEIAKDAGKAALLKRERFYIRRAVERFGDGCLNVDRATPLQVMRGRWDDL